MALFKRSENTSAYLKAGFMGFAGDGKTYTASLLAVGLVQLMRKRELPQGGKPVMFLDSETGSDWVRPVFQKADVELHTAKTRAFSDLLTAVSEAEGSGSVLIIDSISHFWRELCDTYQRKKNRTRGLQFQDWSILKTEWGKFTDLYVNSACHAIICGRAGYEYDFFENDDGKKELEKTGIKMKAETETGYEPSILVLMEKHRDMATGQVWRTGSILKDRSTQIDGKTFKNPTFNDFMPHINYLALGCEQLGVDTQRKSDELFAESGDFDWKYAQQQKEIALEEITEIIKKHYPGQSVEEKKARQDLIETHAGTLSWKRVESTFNLEAIQTLRNTLWLTLEGHAYGANPKNGKIAVMDSHEEEMKVA